MLLDQESTEMSTGWRHQTKTDTEERLSEAEPLPARESQFFLYRTDWNLVIHLLKWLNSDENPDEGWEKPVHISP